MFCFNPIWNIHRISRGGGSGNGCGSCSFTSHFGCSPAISGILLVSTVTVRAHVAEFLWAGIIWVSNMLIHGDTFPRINTLTLSCRVLSNYLFKIDGEKKTDNNSNHCD